MLFAMLIAGWCQLVLVVSLNVEKVIGNMLCLVVSLRVLHYQGCVEK